MGQSEMKLLLKRIICLFTFAIVGTAHQFNFILRGKGGNLASPNYPRNYPLNVSCIWTIIPPEDKLVEIDFVDFDLEKNKRCRYDYMQIREFSGQTGIFVKRISSKFCGNRLPEKYISLPRTRTEIRFVSDPYSEVAKGFRALWRLIPLSSGSAERPLSFSRSTSRPTTSKTSARTSTTSTTTLKSSGPTTVTTPCETRTVYIPRRIPCPVVKKKKCHCPSETIGKNNVNDNGVDVTTSKHLKTTPNPMKNNKIEKKNHLLYKCNNETVALGLAQSEAANDSLRRLVIAFGCLAFILLIANIIILFIFYRREKRFNLPETCSERLNQNNTRKITELHTPETAYAYSSLPKPMLKMINGDVMIVPGSVGRLPLSRQPSLHTTDGNSYSKSMREKHRENILDLPIHMTPSPPLLTASISTGVEEPAYEEESSPMSSDEESDY